jgi:HEPN domain-containing protein
MTLGSLDRAYSKEMVDEIFKTAREVILMVEAGLSN